MDNKVKLASSKGYRVTKNGFVTNKNYDLVSLYLRDKNNPRSYYCFAIRDNSGNKVHVKVHRLQAYQKYGDKMFEKGLLVRHKNSKSWDNSWNNILIGTPSQNMMDNPKEMRIKNASNPKHEQILKDREKGMTYKEIMKKHSITSKGTVSFIINKSLAS